MKIKATVLILAFISSGSILGAPINKPHISKEGNVVAHTELPRHAVDSLRMGNQIHHSPRSVKGLSGRALGYTVQVKSSYDGPEEYTDEGNDSPEYEDGGDESSGFTEGYMEEDPSNYDDSKECVDDDDTSYGGSGEYDRDGEHGDEDGASQAFGDELDEAQEENDNQDPSDLEDPAFFRIFDSPSGSNKKRDGCGRNSKRAVSLIRRYSPTGYSSNPIDTSVYQVPPGTIIT